MIRWIMLVLCLGVVSPVLASKPFIIKDIRIEGLQRISAGTVFNYLPIKVGQEFNQQKSAQSVKALFKTGFFKDIKLNVEGRVVVITVVERPSIAEINVTGNKVIEKKLLKKSFDKLGFAKGRVFNRSLLDKIEQELRRVYFAQGKYGVKIKTTVTPMTRNRVSVDINISEGRAARIRKINIIGNKTFKDKKLLRLFKLTTPGAFTFYTKNDQYSKQKLAGDIEKLKSFYKDRGYFGFKVNSTQVSISPNKKDIYITINITEGPQYRISKINLAGKLVLPVSELESHVVVTPNSLYSLRKVTESRKLLTERLGDEGYAFARVNSVPEVDKKTNTVKLTLVIDPGRRVYVRRIIMVGNMRTSDIVLRREMRQLEGSWYSARKIKRSQVRLQKLGFFKEVKVKSKPVAGSTDQVDVIFTVKEKPAGNFLASIGYSQTSGVIFKTSIVQDNFLGTGKRVAVSVSTSDVNQGIMLSYTNPYYTIDGVSRGFTLKSQKTDAFRANLSSYSTDQNSFAINYGIPISEYNRIQVSLQYKDITVNPLANSPVEVLDFVNTNGKQNVTYSLLAAWAYDTTNRAIFADKGVFYRISGEVAVPGGDLQFYKIRLQHKRFIPLGRRYILKVKGEVSYGEAFDETPALPFYENYYAGGVKSIRGFKTNTLGPRDSNNLPIGGALKVLGSMEFIFPPPFVANSKSFRISAFVDVGNVFKDADSFDSDELRASAGLSLIWISPLGPLSLSFAQPIKEKPGDNVESVQFSIGSTFF